MLTLPKKTRSLISIICLTLMFSFTLNVVVAQDIPSEVNRRYIQAAKLELTAAPGETVSKSIDVPVRVTLPDGTEYVEYETVTLSLWHDSNSVITWNANSPWSNDRYFASAGAPGSNVTVATAVSFKKGTVFISYKTHQITWTLQGSGSCSASGAVYDGVPDW